MTDNGNGNSRAERRTQTRYSNRDLQLSIAYPGIKGMLRFNPIVNCVDFSSTGFQFECNRPFQLGDRLIIDLCCLEECIDEL